MTKDRLGGTSASDAVGEAEMPGGNRMEKVEY